MKKLVLLAALCAAASACDSPFPPTIVSFTVDNANPPTGQPIRLDFVVKDAAVISIVPEPGQVIASPVTVTPRGPTTYTLRAFNMNGWVSRDLVVNAKAAGGANVMLFSVVPSQAPAGTQRTLEWNVRDSLSLTLSGGGMAATPVPSSGSMVINPTATTSYTISATSAPPFGAVVVHTVARIAAPASITSFTAAPAAILQGDSSTLSWDGSATSWSLQTNDDPPRNLGLVKTLVVRPAATTTYTLTASAPGGNSAPQRVTLNVAPRAGTTLAYTPPTVTTELLTLEADACPAPCTALTLRLKAAAPVSLRGVAFDLPLDSTKVTLDPATFSTSLDTGKAVLGSSPLNDTLVFGAARKGSGTGPATDSALASGAELAHFVLALRPAGGQGKIFDGASAIQAFVQSAAGRTPGGIAVGTLVAQ